MVVATTPDTHRALTLEALDAGKHVVVEKPAFLKAVDFDRVRLVEAHTGRRVMVAENYCYKPIARALREAIASGALGEVRFLSLVAVKQQRVHGWRDDPAVAGGGALFEGGVHWVDLLANVGLEVASVQGYRPGPAQGLERSMLVVVRYTNGGVGTLTHSWEVPSPLHGLRISRVYGTEGAAAFESNGIFLQVTGERRRLSFPGLRDITGNSAMWTDFLDVIRTGREPVMTTARAQRGLEIVEQAYATRPARRQPARPPAVIPSGAVVIPSGARDLAWEWLDPFRARSLASLGMTGRRRTRTHHRCSHRHPTPPRSPPSMIPLLAAAVGLIAGIHTATWGMYKDAPHEGFSGRKYARSIVLATVIAVVIAGGWGLDPRRAADLVVLFGSTYAVERALAEIYKTFLREEDQSKYFIPMQFSVFGQVVRSRSARLLAGAGYVAACLGILILVIAIERASPDPTPLGTVLADRRPGRLDQRVRRRLEGRAQGGIPDPQVLPQPVHRHRCTRCSSPGSPTTWC